MAKTKPSASSSAQKRLAAERAASARQRIQAAQRRRQLLTVIGAVGVVIVVVAILVVVKVVGDDKQVKSGQKTVRADESVTTRVATIPTSVFDRVGVGSATSPPKKTSGTALTAGGLPRVLFVGAEWCPYCAAERWAMTAALSRFGSFTGLGETTSTPSDVYPSTATLSFHGATYTSKYLAFTGKELETNQSVGTSFSKLDSLSGQDAALYKANGSGFPYANLGGKWIIGGAEYDPGVLQGLTQQQIATDLSNPDSKVAKGVDGAANVITADLCTLTNGAPASVCSSTGVTTAATAISGNGG